MPANELAGAIRAGDRRALARGITLVESTRPDHRAEADALVAGLLDATGGATRVGVSGSPGVGKSTFIEALGAHVLDDGHRVAVLAVDPSSARSGGSILGDKTRMGSLARDDRVFIRPSPARGTLGGVARRTREAMMLCEAAGFDVVLIETVGVGQSETAVADMVDLFLLLVAPGAGDELQGLKRGIVELADLVVVTKADGDLLGPAQRAGADYRKALHLLSSKHPGLRAEVVLCSALTGDGVADVWAEVQRAVGALRDAGVLDRLRADQAVAWMWSEVRERLLTDLTAAPTVRALVPELETAVAEQRQSPTAAAAQLLRAAGLDGPGAP
jgi:LAO/AO transport system kinase